VAPSGRTTTLGFGAALTSARELAARFQALCVGISGSWWKGSENGELVDELYSAARL